MTDKSSGDFAGKNSVKNPLLSTAVTSLCLEDLTQSAVLLPVKADQKSFDKQDNLYHETQTPINPHPDLQPEQQKKPPQPPETNPPDDFDINEYFARLQCTGYVSAPIHTQPKPAELHEENLEEVNLNENPEVQSSLTNDLAQNFQQLPQVLPQVATAVYNSFTNMLNYGRGTPSAVDAGVDSRCSEVNVQPPLIYDTAGFQSAGRMSGVGDKPPPVGASTNNYRLSAKKKTYAQIPGLTGQSTNLTAHYIPYDPNPNITAEQNQNTAGNIFDPNSQSISERSSSQLDISSVQSQTSSVDLTNQFYNPSRLTETVSESSGYIKTLPIDTSDDSQNAVDGSLLSARKGTEIEDKKLSSGDHQDVLPPPQMFSNQSSHLQLGPPPKIAPQSKQTTEVNSKLVPPSVARKLSGNQSTAIPTQTPHFFLPVKKDLDISEVQTTQDDSTELQSFVETSTVPSGQDISSLKTISTASQFDPQTLTNLQSQSTQYPPENIAKPPPIFRNLEEICKPVPVEIKPPTYEPPKNISSVNFRLTNKRKPQYYAGPIEGGISSTPVTQVLTPVNPSYTQQQAFVTGTIEFLTPSQPEPQKTCASSFNPEASSVQQNMPTATSVTFTPAMTIAFSNSASADQPSATGPAFTNQMILTPAVSIAFTQPSAMFESGIPDQSNTPFTQASNQKTAVFDQKSTQMFNPGSIQDSTPYSVPMPGYFNQATMQRSKPIDFYESVPCSETYGHQTYTNVGLDSTDHQNPSNMYSYPTSLDHYGYDAQMVQDNSKTDLFGALKSKLSSVNINKLQDAVTSFFDPNYFGGNDNNQINQNFGHDNNQMNQNFGHDQPQAPSISVFTNYLEVSPEFYKRTHQPYQNTQYYNPAYSTQDNQNMYQQNIPTYAWGGQNNNESNPYVYKPNVDNYTYGNTQPNYMADVSQAGNVNVFSNANIISPDNTSNYFNNANMESNVANIVGSDINTCDEFSSHDDSNERDEQTEINDNVPEIPKNNEMNIHGISIPGRSKTLSEDELLLEATQLPIEQLASYPSGPSDTEEHFPNRLKNVAPMFETNNPISFFDNFDAPSTLYLGDNVKAAFENKQIKKQDLTEKLIENLTSPLQYINPAKQPLCNLDNDFEESNLNADISAITDTAEAIQESLSFEKTISDVDTTISTDSNVIEKNSYGFIADNEDSSGKSDGMIPQNACDEIKAVLKSTLQEEDTKYDREVLMPSAPHLEEERSESLDIQQIEADAKRDSINYDEFVIEPSETDDDKIENHRERSLDFTTKPYSLFGDQGYPMQQSVTVQTVVTQADPVVSFASYFDTGNYAVENSKKSLQTSTIYGYEISPDAQNVSIAQEKIMPRVSDSGDRIRTLSISDSPNSSEVHKISEKTSDSYVKIIESTTESSINISKEDNKIHDTENIIRDTDSKIREADIKTSETDSKKSETTNELGCIDEPKVPNPLASYFMTSDGDRTFDSFSNNSLPQTEHAKQFFQLSESQNHYKFSQNNKRIDNIFNESELDVDTEVIAISIVNSCDKCVGEMMDADGQDSDGRAQRDVCDGNSGSKGFTVDFVPPEGKPIPGEKPAIDINNENPPEPSQYKSQRHHWFYRSDVTGRSIWKPFSVLDNDALEDAFHSENSSALVPTNGGRYDVNLVERTRHAVYWTEKPTNVRRCSWFYKGGSDGTVVPYNESTAAVLEEEYKNGITSGEWHRRISLASGESVVLHGPTVMVHFPNQPSGTTAQSMTRPRVVKRGFADVEIDEGEPRNVDHLLLLCHGIGSACDLRFRPVEEVVDEFRTMSLQLTRAHYKTSIEKNDIGRVEVLPVSWHSSLHAGEDGVDKRMSLITLDSIPRLRNFTNDTILDVLLYTSPVFCQTIMDTVGVELNRIVSLFKARNPHFVGGVSLGGHSLGSLILFDLLTHQCKRSNPDSVASAVCPSVGSAGTGQPYITYPRLAFEPDALFALGSPIGMFCCVRGLHTFGEDFRLPTCPAFFNIFHPYDPIAYRIEPLINAELKELPPLLIPHHKGRKRMHLELKETVARVGADIRAKVLESLKNTWSSVFKPNMQEVIKEELARSTAAKEFDNDGENLNSTNQPDESLSKKLGRLNMGRRIDCVLQEAPFELINEYLSAVTSHLCYWESEDTMLLMLREIYGNVGIAPDQTTPAQTLTVEVERPIQTSEPQASSSRNS